MFTAIAELEVNATTVRNATATYRTDGMLRALHVVAK
jgi:hypothetical protein